MDNKFKNKFQTGDSVKILLSLIPSDKKEYAIDELTFCNYHQTKTVIDRVLVDINDASVVYVVSIMYEDNTKKVVLVPEDALEAAEKADPDNSNSYPVPPKANIGDRVGIIPNSTVGLNTQKHIEELTVKAIDYSHETCSFTYTVEDESGTVKVIPERPTDDTYVENMSYICELLNNLRKNERRVEVRTTTYSGKKVITHDYAPPLLPYRHSGRVIKVEEVYTQDGNRYVTYTDSKSGEKISTLFSAIEPLVDNAPKFEEGQIVCIRHSYAYTHNKYKILSTYKVKNKDDALRYVDEMLSTYKTVDKDEGRWYAVIVEKVGDKSHELSAFLERDLMLAPTTVKVRKRQSART